jgi:pyrroline-5-carboxylate reductase
MRIGFIGAGNMAYALAGGILRKVKDVSLGVSDPNSGRISLFRKDFPDIRVYESNRDLTDSCEGIILAVKPQIMSEVLKEIHDFEGLAVSIAAGITIAALESGLPSARVVRVMPNTPVLSG